jgi:hypothetical protein
MKIRPLGTQNIFYHPHMHSIHCVLHACRHHTRRVPDARRDHGVATRTPCIWHPKALHTVRTPHAPCTGCPLIIHTCTAYTVCFMFAGITRTAGHYVCAVSTYTHVLTHVTRAVYRMPAGITEWPIGHHVYGTPRHYTLSGHNTRRVPNARRDHEMTSGQPFMCHMNVPHNVTHSTRAVYRMPAGITEWPVDNHVCVT